MKMTTSGDLVKYLQKVCPLMGLPFENKILSVS